jgi:Holliday junction DNA helicase RuvA
MIAAVRGRLEAMGIDNVVVEVHGISLRVFVPTPLLSELGEIGSEVKLYTHFYQREALMALYGFKDNASLELFELLLGVSGVGPKAALSLVGQGGVEAVQLAIAQSDLDFLKKIQGIGAKTAARIILELKGKLIELPSSVKLGVAAASGSSSKVAPQALERMQLREALAGLGYTTAEIEGAISSLPNDGSLTIEEQVLEALRYLGQ